MNCTLEPWTPGCESYELPEAEATLAVGKLCGMMDWMPGCAVAKVCEATPSLLLCNPFSLLADICRFDMPGMKSCFEYKNMCNTKDSIIRQCREYPPLPYLPTTKEAKQLVQSICTEMRMDGCELCPLSNTISINGIPQCDWFTIYSGLCNAMPDMSQCTQFTALCMETPTFPLCSSSNLPDNPNIPKPPPMMQMYFHFGLTEYILFKSWVPRTAFQYVLSCIVLFSIGIFYEWFLNYQKQWERRSIGEYQVLLRQRQQQSSGRRVIDLSGGSGSSNSSSNQNHQEEEAQLLLSNRSSLSTRGNNRPRLPNAESRMKMARLRIHKGCMRVFGSSLGYMLMLVTMTFNVGLCLAVVGGYGVGSFLFYFDGVDMVGTGLEGVGEDADLCCGYE